MVANRDYAKSHMGVRAANQPPRTTSQYSGSFSRSRNYKRFILARRDLKFRSAAVNLKFQNFKAQKEAKF